MSEMTPTEAAQLVEQDKQRRIKLAAEAVQAALAEHGCDLVALPQIAPDGRVVAVVQLVARQT
jgi:pyruvate/2-oxoglutarate dehydrogenase complex dihydrolipoamide acyltransferase (E2) component